MDFQDYFPIWNKLTALQQNRILGSLISRKAEKGTIIHNGSMDCTGLLLIKSGLLRAYILSDEGREITIYRLFERDMCLFSASCIMRSIQFEITIEAEKIQSSGSFLQKYIKTLWKNLRLWQTIPTSLWLLAFLTSCGSSSRSSGKAWINA